MENDSKYEGRIAIVGMDCRLPGASNTQEYWDNLIAEKETLSTFSDEQLLSANVKPAKFNNPNYVRTRGVIDETDGFDAAFFNITPRDAELLDPQQRVFLECAWHVLEDAGVDPFNTDKQVAVFGGTGTPYYLVDAISNKKVKKQASGTSIITSTDKDYVTTRVSYKLNLKGPSINVQTACSTALVSVVLGVDTLLNHQADVVIAGGVSLELPECQGYMYQVGGLESPDGRCRTFDKDAAGTVFSRGCGVVALKRLEDAVADQDHIYAVVLGGATNNDGNRKVSFTAPSVPGQVEVITEALELAEVNASTISMVEAHGTSTPTGDPIEVASLTEAFRQYTQEQGYCRIGSVKTNIGHTDVASGGASLIKTCLSLKHGIIPASLNYNEPNPEIDFDNSPFYVNTKTCNLERTNGNPLRALVNSFGVGGTNACLILEEPPKFEQKQTGKKHDLLFLSAHCKPSFKAYCEDLKTHIEASPDININALAHTSRVARQAMKYKGVLSFSDTKDLLAQLDEGIAPVRQASKTKPAFSWMFSGQGNQFVDMGRELYDENAVFKEVVDHCAKTLLPILELDIREVLYPTADKRAEAEDLIGRTYITQPAIFIISYAIARVFESYGLKPDTLIGHSVGEYVAAAISGVMDADDALRAVAHRGRLVYDLPQGSMLAVLKSEEEMLAILPDELDIAVINSPELVVVSGQTKDIEAFGAKMKEEGVFSKHLPTSHAFHSQMMVPCLDAYRDYFKNIPLNTPNIPIISTVTGEEMTNEQATDHEYWVQHVLNPVLFSKAVQHQFAQAPTVFLECGPGQSLESAVKRQVSNDDPHASIGTLNEGKNAVIALNYAIGKLWVEDITLDYGACFNSTGLTKVPFPLLPFNRTPYRIDFSANASGDDEDKNQKITDIDQWYHVPSWQRTASVERVARNQTKPTELPVQWIIFSNEQLCDSIVAKLESQGADYIVVKPAATYKESGNIVELCQNNKADFERLMAKIPSGEKDIRIIHGWNFSPSNNLPLTYESSDEHLSNSFFSLVYLEQALVANNLSDNISFTCLIDDGFNVTGSTKVKAEKSLCIGPIRALFKEHTNMITKLINIEDEFVNWQNLDALVDKLLIEAEIETDETIISYVDLVRWAETFEPIRFYGTEGEQNNRLKENGNYFVTGGAGGIGRTLSLLIAEKVKANLIWTGRSEMPPRANWQALVDDENSDRKLVERLKAIMEIEQLGSSIHYYSVDVTSLDEMEKVVKQAEEKLGDINGIVHSAGTAGGGVISLQTNEVMERVLKPKIQGTLILHKLFAEKQLDFVYLYSSITSIFGEAGRVDYTSGNAFMDAFCQAGNWPNTKLACSVNWGEWGEIGMGADWLREKKNKQLDSSLKKKDKVLAVSTEVQPIQLSLNSSADGEETFNVGVDAKTHWIMNEHLLAGLPTMVGTSFIEVLNKWSALKGFDDKALIIADAEFLAPLIIFDDKPVELLLECKETNANQYKFVFKSISGVAGDKDHFAGSIIFKDKSELAIDENVDSLMQRCAPEPKTDRHFTILRGDNNQVLLEYSSRWDCMEKIFTGDDEWVSEIELPESLAQDLSEYSIHPSMLDVATSCHFKNFAKYQGNFLPFSYGEIAIYGAFTPKVLCYGKLAKPFDSQDGHIHFDFIIFNENGEVIMTLDNYTLTKVSGANVESKDNTKAINAIDSAVEGDEEILPDEGKQVLAQLLQQENLAQIIVYPRDLLLDFAESKISFIRKELAEAMQKLEENKDVDDRPDIDTTYEQPENEIEKSITAIWSSILGINKIGANDSFNELGGNSLLAIQVVSGIGDEFEVEIKANEFVNNNTVRLLADLVLSKILGEHDNELLNELLEEEGAA